MDFDCHLEKLDQEGLTRRRRVVESPQTTALVINGKSYLAFCSNDYLGLANHPKLVSAAQRGAAVYGVGSTSSHLICGHSTPHQLLEDALAAFVRLPKALYFSTGYMAALGSIPALVGRGDTIFSDSLNHACLIDGIRLSRAEVQTYPHLDMAALEEALAQCKSKNKMVISDAVFSMDGEVAPIPDLLALCERYDAWLFLDDAHGFGVLGEDGRGTLSHFGVQSPRIIYMATLGKAAGVFGAFIAGDGKMIEWLLQRARSYIFTTAAPPMLATALTESLLLIEKESWRRARLQDLIDKLRKGLADLPWQLAPSTMPIQPIMVGDNRTVMQLAEALLARGIWVPAIRPPTVPQNTARLRISLSAEHTDKDVALLITALHELATQART